MLEVTIGVLEVTIGVLEVTIGVMEMTIGVLEVITGVIEMTQARRYSNCLELVQHNTQGAVDHS